MGLGYRLPSEMGTLSSLRLELLLEEMIYQQLRSRLSKEEAEKELNMILDNVGNRMKGIIESFDQLKPE